MKRPLVAMLLVASIAVPGLASAGAHSLGFVTISDTYMSGSMNVRFNDNTPASYMMTQQWSDGTVTFYGWDGSKSFLCTVSPSDPLYELAFAAHNNLDNGAYLYVNKGSDSNRCTFVALNKRSYLID